MKCLGMLVLFAVSFVSAQDGVLDTGFSGDGKTFTNFDGNADVGRDVAIQSDGKVVVAGYAQINLIAGTAVYFAAVRYNTDGTLDTGFDSDGKCATTVGSGDAFGYAVALQSDGKIVLAGYASNGSNNDFAVIRYNSDGTLDIGFDSDGRVMTAVGSGGDAVYDVVIQPDGKIVAAGVSHNGTNYDIAVVRYNSNGTLDTGFDGDGIVITPIGSGDEYGYGVALQQDGKIVVAGYSYNGSNNDVAVVRYNSDGSLDTGFDGDGIVTTAVGVTDYGYGVAVQADSKIVVAGFGSNDFAVLRYNSDGTPDTGFDSDGTVTTAIGSGSDIARSVVIQLDGKIVVAGYAFNGTYDDFAVARYNSDGTLDTDFSGDGKIMTAIGTIDQAYSVAIQSNGKIVAAGYSSIANQGDFSVICLTGSSGPLPVELTSFTGAAEKNNVGLKWTTATEVNNYGFEIERSEALLKPPIEGTWMAIGFVTGNGTSNMSNEYSFADRNLKAGKYFYRLKQIDNDGKFEYSRHIEVTVGEVPKELSLAQNYPNPFNPTTRIQFEVPVSGFVSLKIYDLLGRVVTTLVSEVRDAGNYEVQFDAAVLAGGMYFAKLEADGKQATKRLLLMK